MTDPCTSRWVAAPIRISPTGAACWSRAAVFMVSPVAMMWAAGEAPTTTSPVAIPISHAQPHSEP